MKRCLKGRVIAFAAVFFLPFYLKSGVANGSEHVARPAISQDFAAEFSRFCRSLLGSETRPVEREVRPLWEPGGPLSARPHPFCF